MEEETTYHDLYDAPAAFPSAPLPAPAAPFPSAPAPTTGLPTTGLPTTGLPTTGLPTAGLPLPSVSRDYGMERMAERVAPPERAERTERIERVAPLERTERTERTERVAPPERTERVDHMKGETLTIANPGRIFPYIMAQESTHFQFKTKEMERRFQQMIEQIPDLTVRFDYGREDKSDILLVSSSDPTQIVGKLHLLLVDRRDRGDPLKRYVKIHLFHMKDPQQFELVRQRIVEFFEKGMRPQPTRTSTTRMPMTVSQKKRVQYKRKRMISLTRKRNIKRNMKRSVKSSIKSSSKHSIKRSMKHSTKPRS